MITSNPITLTLSLITGLIAGGIFFSGLWLTVKHLSTTRHPAILVVLSFVIRVAIVLGAFFLVGRGHFDRMLFCVAGFLVARFVVVRFTRKLSAEKPTTGREAASATES